MWIDPDIRKVKDVYGNVTTRQLLKVFSLIQFLPAYRTFIHVKYHAQHLTEADGQQAWARMRNDMHDYGAGLLTDCCGHEA